MESKKYIGFSIEDLLHDDDFVSIVKKLENTQEWEEFLEQNSESKDKILQAQKIISLFKIHEGELSSNRKSELWNRISKYQAEYSGKERFISRRTILWIAASFLLILSVGSVAFLKYNSQYRPYQFSDSRNNFASGDPLLVLSNGNKVRLEKEESKITVLKGRDEIQINNDSIVKNQTIAANGTDKVKFNEVIIPFGKKSKLILEDGTKVWLNAGSRFAFPQKFEGKKREVILEGEAYFEVAKNPEKPFVISTDNVNLEVLGTKFNVSAYATDNFCETVLLEGKVNIWEKKSLFNDKIPMSPNQKATFKKTGKGIELTKELHPENYIVWIEGWYQFTNENLQQVLKKLERYYNIRFEYDETAISAMLPVSGKLDLKDSLNEVMLILSKVAKFEYQITNNCVKIRKRECSSAQMLTVKRNLKMQTQQGIQF